MSLQLPQKKQNKNFLDIWNLLSLSQKNVIYKLGLSGWQLDYTACDLATKMAKVIHYNGDQAVVNFLGEVDFKN